MFGSRNVSSRIRTVLANTAWHGTSCVCERLGSTFTGVNSSSLLALPRQVLGPPFPYFIQGLHPSCLILSLLFPSFFPTFFLAYAFFP